MKKFYYSLPLLCMAVSFLLSGCSTEEINPAGTPETPGTEASAECIKIEGDLIAASNINFTVSCPQSTFIYEWDFGDNNSGSHDMATHKYSKSGTYVVVLKLKDYKTKEMVKTASRQLTIAKPAFYTHKGYIHNNQCWEEGIHIISEDVYLAGGTVCIEPGAVIKFNPGTFLTVAVGFSSGVESQLTAEGTAEKPILFTSNAENPLPGDYIGLKMYKLTEKQSVFRHCIFEYGGKPEDDIFTEKAGQLILMETSSAVFENCTFRRSASHGLYLDYDSKFASFSNNRVHDVERYAIYLNGNYVPTIGANNQLDSKGLQIWPMVIEQDTRWEKQSCPYIISGNSLVVGSFQGNPEPTFEIAPGVEIQFQSGSLFMIGSESSKRSGKLIAHGTAAEPIVFTAMETGWRGVSFQLGASPESSMQYCVFDKVKNGENEKLLGAINIFNSEVNITHSSINTTKDYSVYLDHSGTFRTFENNELGNPRLYSIWIPIEKVPTIGGGNTFSGQKRIYIYGYFVNVDATWRGLDIPYYIGTGLQVGSDLGATLTLLPGVTIEFGDYHKLDVGHDWTHKKGTLIANGSADNPILLTKGNQTGKWGGVHFSLYTGANSILNYCNVNNASSPAYVKDVPLAGVPVLSNSKFSDASYYGISIEKSDPTLSNNTFSNNLLGEISRK